jgi:DNA polymerase III subunit delta
MGGRRLVRLRLGSEKTALDRLAAEAVSAHAAGGYNPEAMLIVEAGALEKSSALRKAAEAAEGAAAIAVYEDEAGDVARLVREALAADGLQLSREALDLFVARLPKERGVARQEIERLALYLGPAEAGERRPPAPPEALDAFLGVEPEASLFDAAADAFGGRLREAQAGLRRARAEGEGGPAVVRALSQHAGKLRRALVLVAGGREPAGAAKASGVFWRGEREFVRQLGRWRMADLDQVQPELLEADRACKSTGAPDDLLAERALMAVAGRARRLGL